MLDTSLILDYKPNIHINNIKSLCKHYMVVFQYFADSAIILDNHIYLSTKIKNRFTRIITVMEDEKLTILPSSTTSSTMYRVKLK